MNLKNNPNTSLLHGLKQELREISSYTVFTREGDDQEDGFFCMLRNTRSKLMRIIYHLRFI